MNKEKEKEDEIIIYYFSYHPVKIRVRKGKIVLGSFSGIEEVK